VLAVGKDLGRDYATFVDAMAQVDADAEIVAFPRNLEGVSLPPRIRTRRVDSGELRALYARASCVVIPQHPEGYVYGAEGGLTALLDAMAMARPVVATDRLIIREYIDDGVEALLVPARDADALATAIHALLDNPARADAMGAAGRARVERAHTTLAFAAQLADVLHTLEP
jgi:glycosyltransferase involved in cell wall biosynthesis